MEVTYEKLIYLELQAKNAKQLGFWHFFLKLLYEIIFEILSFRPSTERQNYPTTFPPEAILRTTRTAFQKRIMKIKYGGEFLFI